MHGYIQPNACPKQSNTDTLDHKCNRIFLNLFFLFTLVFQVLQSPFHISPNHHISHWPTGPLPDNLRSASKGNEDKISPKSNEPGWRYVCRQKLMFSYTAAKVREKKERGDWTVRYTKANAWLSILRNWTEQKRETGKITLCPRRLNHQRSVVRLMPNAGQEIVLDLRCSEVCGLRIESAKGQKTMVKVYGGQQAASSTSPKG